jgi:Domain of unknown function (DUF4158)
MPCSGYSIRPLWLFIGGTYSVSVGFLTNGRRSNTKHLILAGQTRGEFRNSLSENWVCLVDSTINGGRPRSKLAHRQASSSGVIVAAMPVEFLADEQARSYGRYAGEPTPAQLARFFYLDGADRELLADRRGDHNRLGLALQIVTARFLGTLLADPTDVPTAVIGSPAAQLGIPGDTDLRPYRDGEARWDHAADIRKHYDYRDFGEQPEHFQRVRWLYTRAWLSTERPSVLFDLATAWLVERKVVLPGVSLLARLVASVRDRAAARLWHTLSAIPNEEQRARLDRLLVVPAGARASALDRLRRAPTRASAPSLVDALKRLKEVRDLGMSHLELSHIPVGRLTSLARYAATSWAPVIARMPADRRIATLLAFAHVYEASAQDDALDVFDMLIGTLLTRVENEGDQARLRTLRDLDAAALRLRDACRVALDTSFPDDELREPIFAAAGGEDNLEFAITTVGDLTRPPEDHYYEDLLSRYSQIRQFLPTLLRTITFLSTAAGKPVLEAIAFLRTIEDQRKPNLAPAPRDVVNRAWRSLVLDADDHVDRHAYTFCALERLQDALRRRDIYVVPSERWANPRAKLLQGAALGGRTPRRLSRPGSVC